MSQTQEKIRYLNKFIIICIIFLLLVNTKIIIGLNLNFNIKYQIYFLKNQKLVFNIIIKI